MGAASLVANMLTTPFYFDVALLALFLSVALTLVACYIEIKDWKQIVS